MIKVLVVDDSAVAREFLVHVINASPGLVVVGTARDGIEAVEAAARLRPDIISMDIIMPRMDGPEAIDRIMQANPCPIVVVTGNTITEEVRATFQSLASGALAIVPRPESLSTEQGRGAAGHLVDTLRLMSEIKVVRRLARRPREIATSDPARAPAHSFRVVAVGASTGGPSALRTIIGALSSDFPSPIVIVQHIAAGFVDGFVSWLAEASALPVRLATQGMKLENGYIYIAPDGAHLGVDADERVVLAPLARDAAKTGLCPSVAHLFDSVARIYGSRAVAILLSGMGRDGADGLLALRRAGALTIAQDKESSVVHGMPGEAIALGAAAQILPPPAIADLLNTLAAASAK